MITSMPLARSSPCIDPLILNAVPSCATTFNADRPDCLGERADQQICAPAAELPRVVGHHEVQPGEHDSWEGVGWRNFNMSGPLGECSVSPQLDLPA